jgi:hypothetical protein
MHFGRELNEILAKHGIPEKWRVNLFYWALTGRHVIGIAHSIGFPRGEWSRDESGQFKHQIIIDSETDVANPIVQDYIRHFQLLEDPPPQPQPMKDNPREKDWRPVWEWRKRHPGVTHQEIAKMLSYSPTTVRHKLAQFEEK